MRLLSVVTVVASSLSFAAAPPFTFAVLGDRTGGARHEIFCQVVEEIRLARPDLVIGVGDLVEGYTDDTAALAAEWDTVLGTLARSGIPYQGCPGNHDIFDAHSESAYVARLGPPYHSFRHSGAHFVFIDNSRFRSYSRLPEAQRRWLRTELRKAGRARHSFVVMHRPFWKYARENDQTDSLHLLCVEAGIDMVFSGHDHYYCSSVWDGIRYFQVGPSGSRYKIYREPDLGAFQNYLLCRVAGDSIQVRVVEPGGVRTPDVVTWKMLNGVERARSTDIGSSVVIVDRDGAVRDSVTISFQNTSGFTQEGELRWNTEGTAWSVSPDSLRFLAPPDASWHQVFELELTESGMAYPLPSFSLPYRYAPGRSTTLEFPLTVRRRTRAVSAIPTPVLDGRLDDPCWQDPATLGHLGGRTGGVGVIEQTEAWLAFDDSLLYFAARCRESVPDSITTGITARDDRVYRDDHLNLVLDPDRRSTRSFEDAMQSWNRNAGDVPVSGVYYQVFVNAAGTVADRKCWLEADSSIRDYSWNGSWNVATMREPGAWTLEMSCPLRDLGYAGRDCGINLVRFQSRLGKIGVWQPPFRHDPRSFGILER